MQEMTGEFEHGGQKYSWWAGSSDQPSEWCVHCRDGVYGVTRYRQGAPDQAEARELAEGLAPLVQRLAQDSYTT